MESTMNDTTSQTITAQRGHSQAMAFARKGGDEMSALLFSIAKRKEEEGKGPLETRLFLETHFSDDEASSIPEVGSKKGETGNKPFDRYTSEVQTSEGKKNVPGSWFTDVIKSTPAWAVLNQRREWCKQGQGEGVPDDILAMNTGERATEAERIKRFITNMRTGLTKGAQLYHQVEVISALNPERVKVKLPQMEQKDKNGDAVTVVTGSLIRVYDPSGTDEEPEILTVSQFLQWDAAAAAKDPDKGTIKSLKATAHRAPKKKAGTATPGQGTAYVAPATIEQLLTLFNVLASGLDNGTDQGKKLEAALLAKCAKDGAEGDEAVVSVGTVGLAMDNVWTVISNRYNSINARKAAAMNVKVAV